MQVTELEGHTPELIAIIKKKVDKQERSGRENRNLLVKVREHGGETFCPDTIATDVATLDPTFKSIWLLMEDAANADLTHLIRAWPTVEQTAYRLSIECAKPRATAPYVRLRRGATTGIESESKTIRTTTTAMTVRRMSRSITQTARVLDR